MGPELKGTLRQTDVLFAIIIVNGNGIFDFNNLQPPDFPMKNRFRLIPFILCITITALAQKPTEQQQVQQVLRVVFEAFSEGSLAKMEQALTPDVKMLETGEVWTLDTIRS